jgi:hypothetical protein
MTGKSLHFGQINKDTPALSPVVSTTSRAMFDSLAIMSIAFFSNTLFQQDYESEGF